MEDIPRMITVKADNRSRIKLPDAKPGQVFVLENNADASITITLVRKAEPEKGKVTFIKKNGFTVGHTDKKVSAQAIMDHLAEEFP
jgi:hypothetical protein